jgi:hypothetical protein
VPPEGYLACEDGRLSFLRVGLSEDTMLFRLGDDESVVYGDRLNRWSLLSSRISQHITTRTISCKNLDDQHALSLSHRCMAFV